MVVLGLLLIAAGALAIVAALFTAHGTTELVGLDLTGVTMFFVGLAAGVLVLVGWSLAKWGTKRTLQHRRDSKRLDELSARLDRREHERREDDADNPDRSH
jgi:MFS superfamily sulfate permease-like transporter